MSCPSTDKPQYVGVDATSALRLATLDQAPIAGLTHRFYRYPARFSPRFAAAAIELFSRPGDLIIDPYMGGATTIVEAMVRNREVIGSDINSLSVFLGRVKTTPLSVSDREALQEWADNIVPTLSYWSRPDNLTDYICVRRTHNLTLPQARPIKKVIALALRTLDDELPSKAAREFARCALLNAAQLFLNGQKSRQRSLPAFRSRLRSMVHEMLVGLAEFEARAPNVTPTLLNCSAAELPAHEPFASGRRASLVVTSPPYPGIHMLYHRWQVDGRRESPAPYWMANCDDGRGNSFYNFADRCASAEDKYFTESLRTLKGIRTVTAAEGIVVQLVAFSDPARQLPRYLTNMRLASFEEVHFDKSHRRLWRDVPSRRWHANSKGKLGGSREVVLVHRAS